MRALRAVGTIFTAAPGLYAEQTTALNVFAVPMLEMDGARLADEIEERLVIEGRDFFEIHQVGKVIRGRRMIRDSSTLHGMTRRG